MTEHLSWDQIRLRYGGQWVILVDHDWPTTSSHPHSGIVKFHGQTEAERDQYLKEYGTELPDAVSVLVDAFKLGPSGPFMGPLYLETDEGEKKFIGVYPRWIEGTDLNRTQFIISSKSVRPKKV